MKSPRVSSAPADSAAAAALVVELDEEFDALSVEFRRGNTFGFGTFLAYSMAYASTASILGQC